MTDYWRYAHTLREGDMLATHYGEANATVLHRITGQDDTILIVSVPSGDIVRTNEDGADPDIYPRHRQRGGPKLPPKKKPVPLWDRREFKGAPQATDDAQVVD